jgi:hypothetical protein
MVSGSLINYCKIAKNKFIKMKKILFIALFAIIAISCDKKDDNNTNSIEGRWTINEQVETFSQIGSSSISGTNIPGLDTTIVYDSTSTVITPVDSLDGSGIEFLSNGNAIFFDEDGNDDTTTYTFSNNVLELVIAEGSDNGTDTTYIIPVSNLTSNSADLLFYNFSETIYEVDTSFGITVIDFTISTSLIMRVIK